MTHLANAHPEIQIQREKSTASSDTMSRLSQLNEDAENARLCRHWEDFMMLNSQSYALCEELLQGIETSR